jgi:hypothetical protein
MKARFPAVREVRLPLLALALSAPALAQDPAPSSAEDVHQRMRQLVVQIEKGLGHVDRLLWSADRPDADGQPGLAARLAAARERSRRVLDDIDELLEIRHHPHDARGGGS